MIDYDVIASQFKELYEQSGRKKVALHVRAPTEIVREVTRRDLRTALMKVEPELVNNKEWLLIFDPTDPDPLHRGLWLVALECLVGHEIRGEVISVDGLCSR